jgi:hypothetical protein
MFDFQNPKTGEIYELPDEDNARKAMAKGYIPLNVKHPKTGEMFALPNADEVSKAIKSGYMPAIALPKPPKAPEKTSTWQDINTVFDPTLGFKDEIWGAVGALTDPANLGGNFGDRYAKYRDAQRGAVTAAKASSPSATTVAEFAGGIPTMAIPGAVGAKAVKAGIDVFRPVASSSLLTGVTEAAGRSNATTASEYATDIGLGAATSLVLPGAMKGLQLGAKTVQTAVGAGKAIPRILTSSGVLGKGEAMRNAASDIFSNIGNSAALRNALSVTEKTTDNEIKEKIFKELSQEGTSPFKKWLAGEIASRSGSTGTAPDLEGLFALGSKARTEARAFGPEQQKASAENITDLLKGLETNVKEVRGQAFEKGMKKASEEFQSLPLKPVMAKWKALQSEAAAFIPDEGEESLLNGADQDMIMKAMRIINTGDIKGIDKVFPNVKAGDNPTTGQLFWRLQAARQLVDKYGKKINREGFNEQATAMNSFRDKIDDVLKLSKEKSSLDATYAQGSQDVMPVFGKAIKTKPEGGGRPFIEPAKVQGMFQGTRAAETFGRRLDKMQQFLDESGLPFDPDIGENFFKEFGKVKTTAANRRLIESMKRQGGPSAQAIEALAGQNAKNVVQEIIVRPSAVLQKIDETIAQRGGTFTEKELSDLAKWRSAFDKLAKDSGKAVLPSNAWALGLSFAASKLGSEFIKQQMAGE